MHRTIQHCLDQGVPVLLDGAWGTQFQSLGLPVGACPDAWNLEQPDKVIQVARAYVEAGSRIILSNTFGANRYALESHGLQERVGDINRRGAELSKEAAGDRALVFASMGPSGKMLLMGDVTEDELLAAFSEQAEALAAGGADGLVIETMGDIEEAVIAVRAAVSTGLPVVGCMVYDCGPDGDRTMMGTDPETQAQRMAEAGVHVLGSNCGKGIEGFLPTCRRLRAASGLPLWIKANAGLPVMIGGATTWPLSPESFAEHLPPLIEAGASFVGGCCGTSPAFIRAMAQTLADANGRTS